MSPCRIPICVTHGQPEPYTCPPGARICTEDCKAWKKKKKPKQKNKPKKPKKSPNPKHLTSIIQVPSDEESKLLSTLHAFYIWNTGRQSRKLSVCKPAGRKKAGHSCCRFISLERKSRGSRVQSRGCLFPLQQANYRAGVCEVCAFIIGDSLCYSRAWTETLLQWTHVRDREHNIAANSFL